MEFSAVIPINLFEASKQTPTAALNLDLITVDRESLWQCRLNVAPGDNLTAKNKDVPFT